MSPTTHFRSDLTGRIVGILVFLLGIGMLVIVFRLAYALFNASPNTLLGLKFTGNAKTDPGIAVIGARLGGLLINVLCLFVMSSRSRTRAPTGLLLPESASNRMDLHCTRWLHALKITLEYG